MLSLGKTEGDDEIEKEEGINRATGTKGHTYKNIETLVLEERQAEKDHPE